jgi:preprotein translocase SecE subunit
MPPETETKEKPEKAMASTVATAGGAEEPRDDEPKRKPEPVPPPPARSGPSFFAIYKKGQGYWTRMGTAVGAALLGALTAYNLYVFIPLFINLGDTIEGQQKEKRVAMGVASAFLVAFTAYAWHLMNKPSNVDFLIATDSEMKKVNWTSRKDLIGSTKVVIVFMFLIAIILFGIDIAFSYFFYAIHVLRHSPFGGGGTIGGG